MIYNWTAYLRNKFPAELFYSNQRVQIGGNPIPDRNVLSMESGGVKTAWDGYLQKTIQVIVRDSSTPKARELAFQVYDEMHGRFGLVLPAATVDGTLYNSKHTAEIAAIQEPFNLGADDDSRTEFSMNFIIYFRSE